ncbi:hypothetical protein DL96DRAFT_1626315 [Flagelloscypha sp. PMI_526]|nr:hypothetical protein DL96DRAFT_1626315 [Flagelloscypha sp. PMI_526]
MCEPVSPTVAQFFPPMNHLTQVDWSDRILFASCLIFFYDSIAIIPAEWRYDQFCETFKSIPPCVSARIFAMQRYSPLAVYVFLARSIGIDSWELEVKLLCIVLLFFFFFGLHLTLVTRGRSSFRSNLGGENLTKI